jgi:hypothetical protein
MSAMAGHGSKGREIATQVISIVEKLTAGFWELATLGEAYLLIKNKVKSIESYVSARKLAGNDWGKVTSVHNQLWLLNHYQAVPNEVMKLFAPPNVIAFSGHMIDQPGRATPRFPAQLEGKMKESIRNSIRTLNARIGYSSLACGSDVLFVEAMIEEGGEVNLMLPFNEEDFIKTSLAFAGQHWVDRFKKIISAHPVQLTAHGNYGNNDDLFAFLSRSIYGQAVLRSNAAHSQPYLLTVSSEVDLKRKTGGTKDTVDRWPFPQRHLNINPDIFISSITINPSSPFEPIKFPQNAEQLAYMVYLGFNDGHEILTSKIDSYKANIDDDMRRIIATQRIDQAIILAFQSESATMEFISHLEESLIPARTSHSFKVALHAGLVLTPSPDQMLGLAFEKLIKIGKHIVPGSIYASELFASFLALNTKNYVLQYAGVLHVDQSNPQPFYMVDQPR